MVKLMPIKCSDVMKLIGMSVVFAGLDLEQALGEIKAAGFDAVEVFIGHLGPMGVEVPIFEAHAFAAGELVRSFDLDVSTFNCIIGDFDPFTSANSFERTYSSLAQNLRLAHAMGSNRVLIWDGEIRDLNLLPEAPARLGSTIERARELAGLESPPDIAVELHPNTFAFKNGMYEKVAEVLQEVGAGVCLDFCHAAVALGPDFARLFSPTFVESVSHVHFADSDCISEQLHFPPGFGCANISAAEQLLEGRGLAVAWDLFGWPSPRHAISAGMGRYREAVMRIGNGLSTAADGKGSR